jgi:ABC-type methionine transport system ATPase subunit
VTQRIGKRTFVVGSSNAGKSTLARRRDLESWVHHPR